MNKENISYDVAIIGGGPAGLSAALVLGRSCRQVVVFDDGQYRNYAARQLNGFLGHDGIAPQALRQQCREELRQYNVQIVKQKVLELTVLSEQPSLFRIQLANGAEVLARKIIFATGMVDELPDIPGLLECYGRTVHHCPYCDAWEHRDQALVLLGYSSSDLRTAFLLQCWSKKVAVCTNGHFLSVHEQEQLQRRGIELRQQKVTSLQQDNGELQEILFEEGPPLPAAALFFSSGQAQRSELPASIGCKQNADGRYECEEKQKTEIPGVYIVGDAAKDLQFAIIAAAEGAKAAVAVHEELLEESLAANREMV
jgi:thioredoxin reductase